MLRLRSANKLLQQVSQGEDLPLDQKLETLQSKICPDGPPTTILHKNISLFSTAEVWKACSIISRQSASAIDGWSADLLTQSMQHDPSIVDDLAVMLTQLLQREHSPKLLDILKAGRLVAVPKADGGVRPIVLSNFFVKIIGNISTARDNRICHPRQLALRVKNGCERIIHHMRAALADGKAVVKFDISNAFNSVPKGVIEHAIRDADETIRQYFRLIYGSPGALFVYDVGSVQRIERGNGFRQGDSTARYLFCHSVDRIFKTIADRFELLSCLWMT